MAMCLNGRKVYKGIECMMLICFWLFGFTSWKKESPLKLREEKKTGKDFSFVQIDPVKEEIVEFSHQNLMLVIVMFVSKASANAFLPESLILLEMECDSIIIN